METLVPAEGSQIATTALQGLDLQRLYHLLLGDKHYTDSIGVIQLNYHSCCLKWIDCMPRCHLGDHYKAKSDFRVGDENQPPF